MPDATSLALQKMLLSTSTEEKPLKRVHHACCQRGDRDSSPQCRATSEFLCAGDACATVPTLDPSQGFRDLRGSYAQNLAEEKIGTLAFKGRTRARLCAEYKASCHWAVKYLEGGKNNHFAGLDDFRQKVEVCWRSSKRATNLTKSTLESRWSSSPKDVWKCALALVRRKAVEELTVKKLADSACRTGNLGYPIGGDNGRKEVPLKESLEAHAIRLAKKKGVKGKAILCDVGAAHLPRSDGVPVSVATVSPKDSELLGKLESLGMRHTDCSPSRIHCHRILGVPLV
ncbi:hypothetical protein Tco_1490717 [Tanacetum coccineum]